ncbi:hypothetical protein KAM477_34290 [Aeromonas caviae]|nr:hypothetical protein KAM473_22730 [Aeromonas caviae]GKR62807.1 hypothetical protein KAM477_34290 [Aeromonas caviae]
MSDSAEFLYKTTDYYHPESEACIIWNDSDLNIAWPFISDISLSGKDSSGKNFKNASYFMTDLFK